MMNNSTLRQYQLDKVLPKILEVARQSGEAIMELYLERDSHFCLKNKEDRSPLTMADIASHNNIVSELARLTPDIPIVSEEDKKFPNYCLGRSLFWLVDPLDGTKEFISKNGEFTVNISLVSEGSPIWGVVFAPALEQMYWGGKDFGSYLRMSGATVGVKISSNSNSKKKYKVLVSRSHLNQETVEFTKKLGAIKFLKVGSSLKFCKIASGAADIYPRFAPTYEWDTAAGQAVLEGAGGYVVDTFGAQLKYGKESLINPSFIASALPYGLLRAINV
jgi:3'(2'), 5'-bisphosphate nucleotidase